ncbi:MAG: thermonuclease family protein [Proteobacteria bacterium]|nr:thermonuclease family protein [Pseudomonadota bacterium]
MRALVKALLFLLMAAVPEANAQDGGLKPGPAATVAVIVDGDTVVLESPVDGAIQVRLVGIQAPKLPLGRKGFPTWPLAAEAKQALAKLVLGKTVSLSFGGTEKDRHGRLLAHLHRQDGDWIQGRMLSLGMARVYSFPDNRARVAEMLALESSARKAGRGIWGHPFYAVIAPVQAARAIGTFQLVRGRVIKAARVKGRVYLNFGDDWRTDFTVMLEAKARRLFRSAGLDPLALEGRWLRVRGWLKKWNGPMIEATHPEQIELLAD